MPRGSKIGERRGGRERGTPNRRTVLVDRILVASKGPASSASQFVVMLASDQELPADIRMAIARKFLPTGKSWRSPRTAHPINLEIEFNILQDLAVPADQRRKAAAQIAQHILPKKTGEKRWWVNAPHDEHDFAITPEIAAEYRDAKFELRRLSRLRSNSARTANKIEKLRARINAILHRLQCPCPSRYGEVQRNEDSRRLIYFLKKREVNEILSVEENAEEAHRRARLDCYYEGPESAARGRLSILEDKQRRFKKRRGPRLTCKEQVDLRFLRPLYPRHIPDRDPSFAEFYYDIFRDQPFSEDGNVYPWDSKLRPATVKHIEEFDQLPPYCYPPHARLPPLKAGDVLYVDPAGFRWSYRLIA